MKKTNPPVRRHAFHVLIGCWVIACLLLFCGESGKKINLQGKWRVAIQSPGGELPFFIEVSEKEEGLTASVRNGEELLPFTSVDLKGSKVRFTFDHYDSYLEGNIDPTGHRIEGEWSRRSMGGERTRMAFYATLEQAPRFLPHSSSQITDILKDISGEWIVAFGDDPDTPAAGIFKQDGSIVTGTFLTTVGDYRYLAGSYENGRLRLSVFDGAHAFLFDAMMDEGGELSGDFWSRDTYHTTWHGKRGSVEMPDPFQLTQLTNDEGHFRFRFPNLEGKLISDEDPQFIEKPLIVVVFGSWCPNCNDEIPYLQKLYDQYHSQGLEIVGLANEFTGDFDQDRDIVRLFAQKYRVEFPLLIVGVADKKKTAETLSDLNHVLSYPTTIFLDRHHRVQKIHTGFTGPGTGAHYDRLQESFVQIIESMLE